MQNPVPNAYTLAIGGRKPFVVVHTALLELLEPLEVQVSGSCYNPLDCLSNQIPRATGTSLGGCVKRPAALADCILANQIWRETKRKKGSGELVISFTSSLIKLMAHRRWTAAARLASHVLS